MNLSQLRSQIAAFHRKTTAAFNATYTIDSIDIITPAINAAQRKAQNLIEFEYSMIDADLVIGTTLQGDLSTAKLAGTSTAVSIKCVQHVELPVAGSQYFPIEFLIDNTQGDRIKRQAGRQSYDPALTLADIGVGDIAPYAWQQGQVIKFGPASQFTAAAVATGFTARLSAVKFLPEYVDGNTVTVTLSVASPTGQTFTTYGGLLNGSPIYFGNGMALWRNSAGTNWYVTIANSTNINVEPPVGDYYKLTTTSTSPAGTFTEFATGTPTCVVSTPTGIATDFIMENGFRYLLWESILQTNKFIKTFAPRTEGNVDEAAIQAYAEEALQELSLWNTALARGTTRPSASIPGTGK